MDLYQFIIISLFVAILFALQDIVRKLHALTKMFDEWRYEWGQRTPEQVSNAEIMSEIYGNDK